MYQIVSVFCLNDDLMMNTLENYRLNSTGKFSILRLNYIDILRSDNNLNILVFLEALIYTFKIISVKAYEKILLHDSFDNI